MTFIQHLKDNLGTYSGVALAVAALGFFGYRKFTQKLEEVPRINTRRIEGAFDVDVMTIPQGNNNLEIVVYLEENNTRKLGLLNPKRGSQFRYVGGVNKPTVLEGNILKIEMPTGTTSEEVKLYTNPN